jgi:cyclopropane fatty-acyl-phospholipid synthase-like methyltransferase
MPPPTEWQAFFDHHAPEYLQNEFTHHTLVEADLVVEVLRLAAGDRVLDVGCGVGRHALELARRGLRVTGIDISAGMLREARRAAAAAGLEVEWVQADAAQFAASLPYDGAYCLCEGAFGLLSGGDDALHHDRAILDGVHGALRPGARLLLNCLNGMRQLRRCTPEDVAGRRFDPEEMAERSEMEIDTPEGRRIVAVRERGYVPTELRLLMAAAGFEVEALWGGTAGLPFRRAPALDEMELMVLGRKPG